MEQPKIILTDAAEQGEPIACNISQDFYDKFFKDWEKDTPPFELDTEKAKRYFKK